MELKLPPICDLNLRGDTEPVLRDARIERILTLCHTLCAFADHYASAPRPPSPPEVAEMIEYAVEIIKILQEYKQAARAPTPSTHPPKRPWGGTTDDIATTRLAPSPPDEQVPLPTPVPQSPTIATPPAQEVRMTVFDSQPEWHSNLSDEAKAAAICDMQHIRAHRVPIKAKYKKRSRATLHNSCHSCNMRDTPEWRRGPDGQRTLCNACGLYYAKLVRQRRRTISSLPVGSEAPPPIDIAFLRKSARMTGENSVVARLSAGRRRSSGKDRSKDNSPVSSSSKPSSTSDKGSRTWDRCDKGAEPAAQHSHAPVPSPTYLALPAPSPACPPVLISTTLPPAPQTHYATPGATHMNYFHSYVQSGPAHQPPYHMGPPAPGHSWSYDPTYPPPFWTGSALLGW